MSNLYEDDDTYFEKLQKENQLKGVDESKILTRNSLGAGGIWQKVLTSQGSVISLLSLLCSVTYFVHFNFAHGLLRLIYFIFVLAHILISFGANIVVSNNLRNIVLKNQDKDPNNAEFLDFEDDEDDIARKASILAIQRRLSLQRYSMTPIFVSGFFKVLSERDFPM